FGPYARAVRRHPWLVAAITVVAIVVAAAWIAKRSHEYEAAAQILVTPSTDTVVQGLALLTDTVDPARTLQTAASGLSSTRAAGGATGKLGDGWKAKTIPETAKVTPQGDSNIIAVTAKETSSTAAVAAANAAAQAALDVRAGALRTAATQQLAA